MRIYEANADGELLDTLLSLSCDWEKEDSCWGYRANTPGDLAGRRVFVAEDGGTAGYLFGLISRTERPTSVIPEGASVFEVEELYVIPSRRSEGIGRALFRFMEDAVRGEADFIALSTASKNWRAILHFYLDELDMSFWSARLFRKL